jgi:hypothetical protein
MSSKPKKRPSFPDDVHERIARMSKALRDMAAAKKGPMFMLPSQAPELDSLLLAALDAIGVTAPQTFEFEGRVYFLRCGLSIAGVEVYQNAGDEHPVVEGVGQVRAPAGARPGH